MGKFKIETLKTHLSMARIRVQQRNAKQANYSQAAKREIAELLQNGKTSRAEIKTESIVREDYVMEANEILIDLLEMCISRIQVIDKEKVCPPSLLMHISTIIWAANYMEGDDFIKIREDFTLKYGKKFVDEATNNTLGQANTKVVSRLSMMVPERMTVKKYLRMIANQFSVNYDEFEDEVDPTIMPSVPVGNTNFNGDSTQPPTGGSGSGGSTVASVPPPPATYIPGITPMNNANYPDWQSPASTQPAGSVPSITQTGAPAPAPPQKDPYGDEVDLDDIARRLNDLN